ncbi:hypothetical protein H5410_045721 [Solanum commersonii]|uniref:Uncharacterized protein n=1 Tax=Solanum commersonii TaxID=4109 RepID=A0A9J5XCG1_SOLCO|nr:hypothetical protein H5410_045721 [Solanum commersonii]
MVFTASLPMELHQRWSGCCERRERRRGRAMEERREGEEERRERKRGTSLPLVASLERLREKGGGSKERNYSFLWERRRINYLRVLRSLV